LTDSNGSLAEADAALNRLLDHHQHWLLAQPELLMLWTQDRATRRRVAKLVADELLTIPTRNLNENTPPSRAMRRAILAELKRSNPEFWEDASAFLGG
jgi:hypothetical protein